MANIRSAEKQRRQAEKANARNRAGKSRLLAEVNRCDAAQGVLWLEGRSVSFGRSLSYWPFVEILKGAFGIEESDAEALALRKLEDGVRELFGELTAEIVPYVATVMSLELTGDYQQRVQFLKNTGIFGGLLVLALD